MNTFHLKRWVLKNPFGQHISYTKSGPPTGAPKAIATPVAHPAAKNSLLLVSFYKN